jgi:5-methylcytosine-specific restriction endonuclease McrA
MLNGRDYARKYNQSPKGQQHQKEVRNSPKRIAYREEYRSRPEIKESERRYGLNSVHKRMATAKGLPNTFTNKDWDHAVDYFSHRCVYCGEYTEKLQRDHFIPLSAGGGYTLGNIVPACKSCNISKSDNLPEEWCTPAVIEIIQNYFAVYAAHF